MTLQFVGGGVLDESEVNQATTNLNSQSTPLAELSLAPAQPTVKPNDAPGEDVTQAAVEIGKAAVEAADFVAAQKKLREDAIAFLNEKPTPGGEAAAGPEPVKKRRTRGPNKPKSALTPTDLANQLVLAIPPAEPVVITPVVLGSLPEEVKVPVVPIQVVPAVPTQANPAEGIDGRTG